MSTYKKLPRVHLACAKDELRPIMNHILVTKDEICASDAHILVIHKTEDLFDPEFIESMPERILIHKNNWKLFCSNHYLIRFINEQIEVTYSEHKAIVPYQLESVMGLFPEYSKVLPTEKDEDIIDQIAFMPNLLDRLYKSMSIDGCYGFRFEFYGKTKPIMVYHNSNEYRTKGLIMPMMIS